MKTHQDILSLSDISFRWPGPGGFGLGVSDFKVSRGESVLLLGKSGSGKSTLLSLICGTVLPREGQVSVNGTELSSLSGRQRDRYRAEQIGMIFQQFNLLPFGTVEDNILLPLRFSPNRSARAGDARAAAAQLCAAMGLPANVLSERAGKLSVGQQQRVAVARALIGAPPIVIADEPTSALDADAQADFLSLLFDNVKQQEMTLLMVSHDARLADRFDRVVDIAEIATQTQAAA